MILNPAKRNEMAISGAFSCRKTLPVVMLCLASIFVVGCGPSKEDMISRAMRRKRSNPEDSESTALPPTAKPVSRSLSIQPPDIPDSDAAKKPTPNLAESEPARGIEEIESLDGVEREQLTSIDQRKPTTPLSDSERRKMAVDNVKKIHKAMMAYVADHKEFPYYTMESSGGISTFSWRVALLPYLGYQDLYAQFNFERPWDYPDNKALLRFIPPEFVSPERFDTSTNYLVPLGNGLIFHDFTERDEESNEAKLTKIEAVSDGLDNTIVLIEVDDEFAVPWTKPEDYRLFGGGGGRSSVTRGLGQLRGDGAIAIWGNGWPFLLSTKVPFQQLYPAFTYAGNERQLASVIHREILSDDVATNAVAITPSSNVTIGTSLPTSDSKRDLTYDDSIPSVRYPVPNSIELAKAEERFRSIFNDRVLGAKDRASKEKLAREILERSATMDEDLAGAYAMQTAAIELAQAAGSVDALLGAVDCRVAMFEVDAYEINADSLLGLTKATAHLHPSEVDGMEFLERSIRVIYQAVENDDYQRARILTRSTIRLVNVSRNNDLPNVLGRLGMMLVEAERQYDDVKGQLAAFRDNPDNSKAAASVGRYLFFIKGDWPRGLPLLVRAESEPLRRIAQIDLEGASTFDQEVLIADSWWELAMRARPGVYRQGALDRANHWYQNVFEKMPDSLDKIHVSARLGEQKSGEVFSPIALITELAGQCGIALDRSLADVAQSARNKNDSTARHDEDLFGEPGD